MAVAIASTLAAVVAAPAAGHLNNYDSVDGRGLAYEDFTRHDEARQWGIDRWNALGRVNIHREGYFETTDLQYRDYYDSSTTTRAYYRNYGTIPGHPTDVIYFNSWHIDRSSQYDRNGTGTHELGHALSLAHNPYYPNVMLALCCEGRKNYPYNHDRADYYAKW